jgi:cardiolipin synthase
LHPEGSDALAALEHLIDHAQYSLDVMMFIWESDCLGTAIARRLAARAGPNLRVRVLVDGGGNLIFAKPKCASPEEVNRIITWLSQQPHVEVVRTRNPFARFDHRKLVVSDGHTAWTGGRNFSETAFFGQRDLSVTVTGPLAVKLAGEFERAWHEQTGAKPSTGTHQAAPTELPLDVPLLYNAHARLVTTEPLGWELARSLYSAIENAHKHIHLENVYFSDPGLIRRLAEARRRGVDVRVTLTLHSDNRLIDAANRVTANRLLCSGVRVYLYPGMTHVKAGVVDGCWAYLGTGNFDPLSLNHNHEFGLAICDGPVIGELEKLLTGSGLHPEWELKEPLPLTLRDRACALLAGTCL